MVALAALSCLLDDCNIDTLVSRIVFSIQDAKVMEDA